MAAERKLSDAQQFFIQVMLNRSVIDKSKLRDMFTSICERFDVDLPNDRDRRNAFMSRFIDEINDAMCHFNFEIKFGTNETTGLGFYALIRLNDATSPVAESSALYTPIELRVFRKVLEMIIESDTGHVNFNEVINEVSDYYDELVAEAVNQEGTTKKPNPKEIRIIIEKFVLDNWLVPVINQKNKLTLHGRAILELAQYIKQVFEPEALSYCTLCQQLVISYFTCENCSVRFHRHCAKKLFAEKKPGTTPDCPSCKYTIQQEQIDDLCQSLDTAREFYIHGRQNQNQN